MRLLPHSVLDDLTPSLGAVISFWTKICDRSSEDHKEMTNTTKEEKILGGNILSREDEDLEYAKI